MNVHMLDRSIAKEVVVTAIRRGAFGLVWLVGALFVMAAGPFTPWAALESRLLKVGTLAVLFCVLVSVVYALVPLLPALAQRLVQHWFGDEPGAAPSNELPVPKTSTPTQGE